MAGQPPARDIELAVKLVRIVDDRLSESLVRVRDKLQSADGTSMRGFVSLPSDCDLSESCVLPQPQHKFGQGGACGKPNAGQL